MPKLDPGYLNKNGKALMLLECFIIFVSMIMVLSVASFALQVSLASQQAMFNTLYTSFSISLLAQTLALSLGLYSRQLREQFLGIAQRFVLSFLLAYLAVLLIVNWFNIEFINTYALFIATSVSCALICSLRFQLLDFVISHLSKKRLLVLGSGTRASVIEKRMRRSVDQIHFEIVGFAQIKGDVPDQISPQRIVEIDGPVDEYVISNNIEQIVIACDERRDNLAFEQIAKCKRRGVKVIDILEFVENETNQLAIELMYPGWVLYSQPFQTPTPFETAIMQLFNCFLAICISCFAWPFLLVAAIGIKIEDGITAPIFYRQKRVGIHSRPFDIFKLRSMSTDAEKDGAVWAQKNDSRTTKVGRIIRRYRIDELPQLYNVIRGDMGFVGPRPERPEFVDKLALSIPFYNERHHVKPGLTGWAQLSYAYGSSESDAIDKLKFDLYYVKNRSYLFDLLIILRTIEVVLFSKGSR